jgi:hypothetical protein
MDTEKRTVQVSAKKSGSTLDFRAVLSLAFIGRSVQLLASEGITGEAEKWFEEFFREGGNSQSANGDW